MKGSVNVAKLDEDGLNTYIELCALCLARAHARTGDASAIAGYLGKGKSFDKAVANFAMTLCRPNRTRLPASGRGCRCRPNRCRKRNLING